MYLELEKLNKSFDGKSAVCDLSLGVEKGELLCILGSSGCGKTTTLNMIGGFLAPDSGTILMGKMLRACLLSAALFQPYSSHMDFSRT